MGADDERQREGGLHDLPVDPDVEGAERLTPARGVIPQLRSRWDVLLSVAAGGAAGAAARYAIGQAVPHTPKSFPTGTFIVNATGCLAIGVLMVVLMRLAPGSRRLRPLLGVGVLGGYTTFSTYVLESRDLLAGGAGATAGVYLVASVVVGLLAVALGIAVAELLTRRRNAGGATA